MRLAFKIAKSAPRTLGTSRAGGEPDLPVGAEFPDQVSFLLQIRLDDLKHLPAAAPLPSSGLLSFFVDDEDLERGAVFYTPPGVELERLPYPDDGYEANAHATIDFAESLSLPPSDWKIVDKLGLPAAYHDDIYNVLGYETWPKRAGWITSYHQLLGHHRNDFHDAPAAKDVCLLVLSSSEDLEWEWGDGNRLGFYLSKRDLERRRFEEATSMYIDAC